MMRIVALLALVLALAISGVTAQSFARQHHHRWLPAPAPDPSPSPPTPPAGVVSTDPPAPNVADTAAAMTPVAKIIVTTADGQPFTGTVEFGPPHYNAGGCFGLAAGQLVLTCTPLKAPAQLVVSFATTPGP